MVSKVEFYCSVVSCFKVHKYAAARPERNTELTDSGQQSDRVDQRQKSGNLLLFLLVMELLTNEMRVSESI